MRIYHAQVEGVRLLVDLGGVTLGEFRCAPGSPRWQSTNCIGPGHHVVFPRRPVRIRQRGGPEFVADSTQVVVYTDNQEYERRLAGADGDWSHFLAVDPTALGDVGVRPGPAPLPAAGFLRQRLLLAAVHRAGGALEVEELAMELVVAAIAGASTLAPRPDIVEAARERLAVCFAEDLTLAELARPLHVSPFHLARLFRSATGQSLHGYRTELRLRAAVDRIAGGGGRLCDIAADCGFASHSHLTDVFRRRFGQPPGQVRELLAG